MTDRTSYHHGNLKQALIDAGLAILETEGLARLSLRACAERVGVSHTAPKNHFGNFTGLLTAIAGQGVQRLTDAMTAPQDTPLHDRRRIAAEGYVSFARANPALFELMFSAGKVDFKDPAMAVPLSGCAAVLHDVCAGEGADTGETLRAEMRVWSLVHGFATLQAQGVFDKDGMREVGIVDLMPEFLGRTDG